MKKERGITLIALIITIIIMLILVAVTISIVINSGIIGKAQKAKQDTTAAYESEARLGDNLNIEGTMYNGIDEYLNSQNPVETGERLVDIITRDDYGKSTNYSVTVDGQTLNNWKVFLNDGSNVYIIYGDYLPSSLAPAYSRIKRTGLYTVCMNDVNGYASEYFVNYLSNTTLWTPFASSISGATAVGGPSAEQLFASLDKPIQNTNSNITITDVNNMYFPHTAIYEGYNRLLDKRMENISKQ